MPKYMDDFDLVLRPLAHACMLCVLGITKYLGGSWISFALGVLIVGTTGLLLPTDKPHHSHLKIGLRFLREIRAWAWPYRLACCVVLVGSVAMIDAYVAGANLGRQFNVNLIPVFLSSLFLGPSVTFVTYVLIALVVDYFVIFPRGSFEIGTVRDAGYLLMFIVLAWLVIMTPQMLYKASILNKARSKRMRRAEFF